MPEILTDAYLLFTFVFKQALIVSAIAGDWIVSKFPRMS